MVAHIEKWLYLWRRVKSYVSRVLSHVIMIDTWKVFLPIMLLYLNKWMYLYWPLMFMELRKIDIPVSSLSPLPLVLVTRAPLAAIQRVNKNKVESNSAVGSLKQKAEIKNKKILVPCCRLCISTCCYQQQSGGCQKWEDMERSMQTSFSKKKCNLFCLKQYRNVTYVLINESCFSYISGCKKSCLWHLIEPSMLNFLTINWARFYNSLVSSSISVRSLSLQKAVYVVVINYFNILNSGNDIYWNYGVKFMFPEKS